MAKTPAPCGTDAAYRRHLRHGETPCPKCRRAHQEYKRSQSRKGPTLTVVPNLSSETSAAETGRPGDPPGTQPDDVDTNAIRAKLLHMAADILEGRPVPIQTHEFKPVVDATLRLLAEHDALNHHEEDDIDALLDRAGTALWETGA